jgi:hypothetical protein
MHIVEYRTPECPCEIRRAEFFSTLAAEVFAQVMAAATCAPTHIVEHTLEVEQSDIPH